MAIARTQTGREQTGSSSPDSPTHRASGLTGSFRPVDASQRGSLWFGVPNDPRPRGIDVAIQGLSFDASLQPLAWTNTAWLSVR